jgi:hypothetical protein
MGSKFKLLNKKSQGFEAWFLVIVVLLTFAVFFLILNKAWGEIKTPLETSLSSSLPGDSPVNITTTLNQTTNSGIAFDRLIPFVVIGLFGFVLITAGSIVRHPIMIFVGIIILGVVILIAVVYSNLYNSISSATEFSDIKAQLPIQDKFMQYLPTIVFLMAIGITGMIIYSRSQGGSNSL